VSEGWLYVAVVIDLFSRRVVGDANLDMVMDVEELHLLKRLPIETRLPTCGD
jgi:transposase InsO family protein